MTEANFAPSYKRKPGSDVSTNIERHFIQCATVRSYNNYSKIVPRNVKGHLKNCAKLRSQNNNSKINGDNVERQLANCATMRSNNDKIKIAFTKLTNIVTRKTSTQFTFKMKDFASNKCFFYFINKQKASADAPKPTKNDTIQLETNVIDIEKATIHLKLLSNTSKLQNLIDPMYHESCEMHVINDIQNLNVPDTTHTTCLVLEVSVAIKLSSDDNCQTITLNKALIDTGCTKTIIKETFCQINFLSLRNNPRKSLGLPTRESSLQNTISLCNFHYQNLRQVAKSTGMLLLITQHSSPNMK
jgi:hypothetical protein